MIRLAIDMATEPCLVVIIRSVGRPTLGRALQSVAEQTGLGPSALPPEVIVVDAMGQGLDLPAHSLARPPHVVGDSRRLPRAQAAQFGLDCALARFPSCWALFLDDDDELMPQHLAKLAMALQASPQAVAAHTGAVQLQPVQGAADGEPGGVERARFDRRFEPWELLAANHMPIHTVMFDASRVCAAGVRFDTDFDVFEDWDFWLQVQRAGALVQVPGVSARYWLQPEPTAGGAADALSKEQSEAQMTLHGNEAYWRLWRKWWREAPRSWWVDLLSFTRAARDEQAADAQSLRLMAQQVEQAHQYQSGLEALRDALQGQAAELREEIQAVRHELQAKEHERAHAEQALAQQVEQAHQYQSGLEALRDALQGQAAELREEIQAVRHELQAKEHERAHAEQHVRLLLNSSSWRVTRPLRALGSAVRLLAQLRSADYRRDLWWKVRHRSYRRAPLLRSVWPDPYEAWCVREQAQVQASHAQASRAIHALGTLGVGHPLRPKLSVLMPSYNPPLAFLDAAIESLRSQWYPDWELCLADDASTAVGVKQHLRAWAEREPRIRLVLCNQNGHISAASNAALQAATGQWLVLMDQDDLLPPDALWCAVQAMAQHPEAGLLYSDEDKIDGSGRRFGPYFKPAFDADLLRGQNLISHLSVYRRELVLGVGGFRVGYEGSQDHDLALRCVDRLRADQVVHIPRVLYHWRVHEQSTASGIQAKPYALDAGLRAVQDHLERRGVKAQVQPHPEIPHHVVLHRWAQPIGSVAQAGLGLGWRVLGWGHEEQPVPTAPEGLKPVLQALPSPAPLLWAPSWLHVCSTVKAWAAAVASDGQDFVLLVHHEVAQHGQWSGDVQAWLAHTTEAGVGAAGPARRGLQLQLWDAGWLHGRHGGHAPMARGMGSETHGYYGQLRLAHGVSALAGSALALRLQAIDPQAPGLCLKPGWRTVWTPVATVVADERDPTLSDPFKASALRALLTRTRSVHAIACTGEPSDPSYSPHLCEQHRDHRLASDASPLGAPPRYP
jgi:Skp family chaperone for outer membrane proteins